jgi:hypothetical protein
MSESESEKKEGIKIELRDIIMIATLTISIVMGYFGVIKDHETRLVRLETKVEEITGNLKEIKEDTKEIKNDLKNFLKANIKQ